MPADSPVVTKEDFFHDGVVVDGIVVLVLGLCVVKEGEESVWGRGPESFLRYDPLLCGTDRRNGIQDVLQAVVPVSCEPDCPVVDVASRWRLIGLCPDIKILKS